MAMGTIDTGGGWVSAPTDLPGFGDIQWEGAGGQPRAMVGGDSWGEDMTGFNPSTGFNRIQTGDGISPPIPGAGGKQLNSWKTVLNYKQGATFWVLLFALAAVGFIHARVSLKGGPLHATGGI